MRANYGPDQESNCGDTKKKLGSGYILRIEPIYLLVNCIQSTKERKE